MVMDKNRLQKLAGLLREEEDFDLSDNPTYFPLGSPSFYKRHYAILDNADEEIVAFKDVQNEKAFNDRIKQKIKSDPIFKQAYDYYSENEPNFGASYPDPEYQDELEGPDFFKTFDEWVEDMVRNWDYQEEELVNEEDDFDLSDNPTWDDSLINDKFEILEVERGLAGFVCFCENLSTGDVFDFTVLRNGTIIGGQIDERFSDHGPRELERSEIKKLRRNKELKRALELEIRSTPLHEDENFDLSDNPVHTPASVDNLLTDKFDMIKVTTSTRMGEVICWVHNQKSSGVFKLVIDHNLNILEGEVMHYELEGQRPLRFIELERLRKNEQLKRVLKRAVSPILAASPMLEDEDFDLSDNPMHPMPTATYSYDVNRFPIFPQSDVDEGWEVDVYVEENYYGLSKPKFEYTIDRAWKITSTERGVEETDPEVLKYLTDLIKKDPRISREFSEQLDYVMKDTWGDDDEDNDYPDYGEWERNPDR